jgi:hypothetical protein
MAWSEAAHRAVGPSNVSSVARCVTGSQEQDGATPDFRGLGIIGCVLSGVTLVVLGIGTCVVHGHLAGRHILEDSSSVASVSVPTIAH